MKRRGRRTSQPFSLFAFQDVMASVIGVLFFIVIMMALQMVHQGIATIQAAEETVTAAQVEALETTLSELRKRKAGHESEILEIARIDSRIRTDARGALDDLKHMRATLQGLYSQIAEGDKRTTDGRARLEEAKNAQVNILAETARSERQIAELKQRLKTEGSGPRISYIIDRQADGKIPWLAEFSADKIRVSSGQKAGAVLEFAAPDIAVRAAQFRSWAVLWDRDRYYFVLLVKPSGCHFVEPIRSLLNDLGFETGSDLLPENWFAF